MGDLHLGRYRDRVSTCIARSIAGDHTPHEVAGSFAIGVVITAVPTAGLAVVIFAVIAYLFERVSKVALFATLVVFNPVVKWVVYGASFWVGTLLLGPVPGGPVTDLSLAVGPAILMRQLLGNVLLALGLGGASYVIVRGLVREYQRRRVVAIDGMADPLTN